jgi:N-carbamoylputrescine amidase
MIGHAVANAVAVVAANRIGAEGAGRGAITFYGSSFVCDARGEKLAELGRDEAGIAMAKLDLERLRRVRASMGFFRDRRPGLYRTLAE